MINRVVDSLNVGQLRMISHCLRGPSLLLTIMCTPSSPTKPLRLLIAVILVKVMQRAFKLGCLPICLTARRRFDLFLQDPRSTIL